jgi:DNA-binding MarR family transcriptional regulator
MKYITDTLGVAVKEELWNETGSLPVFLPNTYEFRKAALDLAPCLFVKPKSELPPIPALKKHFDIIGAKILFPCVAILDHINAPQRKALINAKIPFVVNDTQLYLPFMGVVLSEKFNKPQPTRETLMPSSQMLLFYYLYQRKRELHTNSIANKLGFSAMQITRAVKQLSLLGLVSIRKDGVYIIITGNGNGGELFEKATPFLINPVRRKFYVEISTLPKGLPLSGFSALSEYSMLAAPKTETYAYSGNLSDLRGTDTLIDDSQVEVEMWRYNPAELSARPDIADPLSVAASLQNNDDARVEQAMEEILAEILR